MRAVTANEAAWEIAGNRRNAKSHQVVFLSVRRPQEEPIVFAPGEEEGMAQRLQTEDPMTPLKAWFELNRTGEVAARNVTFDRIPRFFYYKNGRWIKRNPQKGKEVLGRIWSVKPTNRELFAIKLLCENVGNPRSFEELRTVNRRLYPTFVEAAQVQNTQFSRTT